MCFNHQMLLIENKSRTFMSTFQMQQISYLMQSYKKSGKNKKFLPLFL
jgi:hypothetical protein